MPVPRFQRSSHRSPTAPENGWQNLVDLHTHVLPGIDDGAASLEESVEIARTSARLGTTVLAATPHVRGDFPTSAADMLERVAMLRERLAHEHIDVDIRPGGELALDKLATMQLDDVKPFALAGNPRFVLVESPTYTWPHSLVDALFGLRVQGVTAVLAHPERNVEIQQKPERLRPIVDSGALIQITASALDLRDGRQAVSQTARRLIDRELVHLVASDAHRPGTRQAGIARALDMVGDVDLAYWLGRDLPGAIVDGAPLPPRPVRTSRSWPMRA